jgi:hypothetical protein
MTLVQRLIELREKATQAEWSEGSVYSGSQELLDRCGVLYAGDDLQVEFEGDKAPAAAELVFALLTNLDTIIAALQPKAGEMETEAGDMEIALMPLAAWADIMKSDAPDDTPLPSGIPHISLTLGHARKAKTALATSQKEDGDVR